MIKVVPIERLPRKERHSSEPKDVRPYIQEFLDSGARVAKIEFEAGVDYATAQSCMTCFKNICALYRNGMAKAVMRNCEVYLVRRRDA